MLVLFDLPIRTSCGPNGFPGQNTLIFLFLLLSLLLFSLTTRFRGFRGPSSAPALLNCGWCVDFKRAYAPLLIWLLDGTCTVYHHANGQGYEAPAPAVPLAQPSTRAYTAQRTANSQVWSRYPVPNRCPRDELLSECPSDGLAARHLLRVRQTKRQVDCL